MQTEQTSDAREGSDERKDPISTTNVTAKTHDVFATNGQRVRAPA